MNSEYAFVGMCIVGRKEVLSACETVDPAHITNKDLRKIYREIRKSHQAKRWPDMAKLAEAGCRLKALEDAMSNLAQIDTFQDHANAILEAARQQTAQIACNVFLQNPEKPGAMTELKRSIGEADLIVRPTVTQDDLYEHAKGHHTRRIEARERGEPSPVISTGYKAVDAKIGGYNCKMHAICGHEGVGKSAMVTGLLDYLVVRMVPALIISIDMKFIPIIERLASSRFKIPMAKWWRREGVSRLENEAYCKMADQAKGAGLIIDPSCATLRDVKSSILRHCDDVRIIIIDYIQKIEVPGKDEENAVRDIMLGLASLEPHLGDKPMILLSQMSNDPSKDELKDGAAPIPNIGCIRKYKDLKRMCETIQLIWRKHHGVLSPKGEDEVGVVLGKARNCPSGTFIPMRWDGSIGRFYDGV